MIQVYNVERQQNIGQICDIFGFEESVFMLVFKSLSILGFLFLIFSFSVYSQSATIIVENANLRGTASQTGRVVATLPNGSEVETIKQTGVWFLVQSPEYVGWLHGNTIKLGDSISAESFETEYVAPAPKRKIKISSRSSSSRVYLTGPRGGCYYVNSNGNKTYVNRSLCN